MPISSRGPSPSPGAIRPRLSSAGGRSARSTGSSPRLGHGVFSRTSSGGTSGAEKLGSRARRLSTVSSPDLRAATSAHLRARQAVQEHVARTRRTSTSVSPPPRHQPTRSPTRSPTGNSRSIRLGLLNSREYAGHASPTAGRSPSPSVRSHRSPTQKSPASIVGSHFFKWSPTSERGGLARSPNSGGLLSRHQAPPSPLALASDDGDHIVPWGEEEKEEEAVPERRRSPSPSILAMIEGLEKEREELQKKVAELEPKLSESVREAEGFREEIKMLEGALVQEEKGREAALALQGKTQGMYEEQRTKCDDIEIQYHEALEQIKVAVAKHSEVASSLALEKVGRERAEKEAAGLKSDVKSIRGRSEELSVQLATETSARKALQERVRDKDDVLRSLKDDLREITGQHRLAEEKREANEASLNDRANALEHRARSAEEQVSSLRLKLAKEEELRGEAERRGRESRGGMADAEERLRGALAQLSSSKEYAARLEEEVARKGERIAAADELDKKREARIRELEEEIRTSTSEFRARDSSSVSEVVSLKEALHKVEEERGRLEERNSAKGERCEELEGVVRSLEGEVMRLAEGKAAAERELGGYRAAERALREEVEALSRRVSDERAASMQAVKENRSLLVEVEGMEDRSVKILKMLQAEEDKTVRLTQQVDAITRSLKVSQEALADKEREALSSKKALSASQADLARLSASSTKAQSEEAQLRGELSRAAEEIEVLQARVRSLQAKEDDANRRAEEEGRLREEARRECRALEDQMYLVQKRGSSAMSELEEAREGQQRAAEELARLEEQMRSMRTDPLGPASGIPRASASPLRGTMSSGPLQGSRGYGVPAGGYEPDFGREGYGESGLGRYLPQQSSITAYPRGEPGGTPIAGGHGGISAYASVGGTPGGAGHSGRLSADQLRSDPQASSAAEVSVGGRLGASPSRGNEVASSAAGGRGLAGTVASPSRHAVAATSGGSATAHPRSRLVDIEGISADLLRRVGGLRGVSSPGGRAAGEGGGVFARSELRSGEGSSGFDARGVSASSLSRSAAASPPKTSMSARLP